MIEKKKYLENELREIGLTPSEKQIDQLYDYYEMVIRKNVVMNLTTITEYQEFVKKHFVDSLILLREREWKNPKLKIIDVGTGAGFPGIPLKILCPETEIMLLDSLNKRILFLEEVIRDLGLTGIRAMHGRAEDYARESEYREEFDCCVSRAVANLSTLVEYCLPFLKIGGEFDVYKAGNVGEELEQAEFAISQLGGKTGWIKEYVLPGTDMTRTIIQIKKVLNTPRAYPRPAGKPSKEPLKKR